MLEVVAQQHAVRQAGERVVQRVVDELRLQSLPIRHVDEQALRDRPAALDLVGHRVRLVAEPDLGPVAGQHPVLRPQGSPVRQCAS